MTIEKLCAALRKHAELEDKNVCRSDLPEILREAADKLEELNAEQIDQNGEIIELLREIAGQTRRMTDD